MRQSFTHRGLTFKGIGALGFSHYAAVLGALEIEVQTLGRKWRAIAINRVGRHQGVAIAFGLGDEPELAIDAMCRNYTIERRWLSGEMIPSDVLEGMKR